MDTRMSRSSQHKNKLQYPPIFCHAPPYPLLLYLGLWRNLQVQILHLRLQNEWVVEQSLQSPPPLSQRVWNVFRDLGSFLCRIPNELCPLTCLFSPFGMK